MKEIGNVYGITGSVVKIKGNAMIREMLYIGENYLLGEVINIGDFIIAQVFEDTVGIKKGDIVFGSGAPLSIKLMPGLIGGIFDGIGKNLNEHGDYIKRGNRLVTNTKKKWESNILVNKNEIISAYSIIATIKETKLVDHHIFSPVGGEVIFATSNGDYKTNEVLVIIRSEFSGEHIEITMETDWPVKKPRPVIEKLVPSSPLITGQRVIDTFFPIALGGTGAIPGGFGTGKTLTIHQIAKHAHADIIIYIGCGERGNEIKGILEDFNILKDPKTDHPLTERVVIIANTSNMPVSAREASIFTGITIAEYYRDMGYKVALMADSTSRFAEGLRELSGRLMEMPAEEGYPAYLPARLASFYERAGIVKNLNGSTGSVTVIGTVSPQGGDMNDIVTQHTKRFVRCFWELDKSLAYSRHFPAINWINSYSEYIDDMAQWYKRNATKNFLINREKSLQILLQENELQEIIKLIGEEVLHDTQKLILAVGLIIRQGFLSQNALSSKDTYTPIDIQAKFLEIILYLYEKCQELVAMHIPVSVIKRDGIFSKISSIKESEFIYSTDLNHYFDKIDATFSKLEMEYKEVWL